MNNEYNNGNNYNGDYLKQSKWILEKGDNIDEMDCPMVAGCKYCVIFNSNKMPGCLTEQKIEVAKNFMIKHNKEMRIKKLNRILK